MAQFSSTALTPRVTDSAKSNREWLMPRESLASCFDVGFMDELALNIQLRRPFLCDDHVAVPCGRGEAQYQWACHTTAMTGRVYVCTRGEILRYFDALIPRPTTNCVARMTALLHSRFCGGC